MLLYVFVSADAIVSDVFWSQINYGCVVVLWTKESSPSKLDGTFKLFSSFKTLYSSDPHPVSMT